MTLKEFQKQIEKLKNHDISALEKIYEEYFGKIYALALSKIGNRQDAYDVSMKVIEKLIYYNGNVKEIINPTGLLIAMTNNTIIDFFRHRNFLFSYEVREEKFISNLGDMLWYFDMMNAMTEEEQEVIIQYAIWGKQLKEIAQEKGKPYITIRRIYQSAKYKIKKLYHQK